MTHSDKQPLAAVATFLFDRTPREFGQMAGRRAYHSTVDDAIATLLSPSAPPFSQLMRKRDAHNARQLLAALSREGFICAAEVHVDEVRHPAHGSVPATTTRRTFATAVSGPPVPGGHIVWLYEGPHGRRWLVAGVLIAVVLAAALMPFWPPLARWAFIYVMLALAAALVAVFFVVRPLAYYGTRAVYKDRAWLIFPNADKEELGLWESLKPLHAWETIEENTDKKRQ